MCRVHIQRAPLQRGGDCDWYRTRRPRQSTSVVVGGAVESEVAVTLLLAAAAAVVVALVRTTADVVELTTPDTPSSL